jgi:pimeloyl-ACP methyl ester carboxylesterase
LKPNNKAVSAEWNFKRGHRFMGIIKINGINISVKEAGEGQDMILIHGKGYSKENMDRLFNHYKERYHVVSYDVRGHGESDKPAAFTLNDDVEDLADLVKKLNLLEPVVIGFSMGSYIALKTAEKYPDIFSKLVLIGTKGGGAISSTQKVEQDAQASGFSKEQIMQQMVRRVFAPQVTFEEIGEFDREIASSVTLTEKQQDAITNSMQDFDLLNDASKVTIPVLVLTGEYDGLNPPSEGKKVADALPNAKFEVIPNAGHIAFFENPDKVFSLIDGFIK